MTDHTDALGGRLPLADPTDLVGAQRELFDKMTSAVVPWADDTGFHSTTDDGRFIGPFDPALLNPAMTSASAELLLGEREHTSLSARLREVVILAVGAVWQSEYELYAHSAAARKPASLTTPSGCWQAVEYQMTSVRTRRSQQS